MTSMKMRTYSELKRLKTIRERYEYLKLNGSVGKNTFGSRRFMNQSFYRSYEWRKAKNAVIIRDSGCNLGIKGYEILDKIYIHHMNPVTIEQLERKDPKLYDPEYLICVDFITHNAIHYGDEDLLPKESMIRKPGDTYLWKPLGGDVCYGRDVSIK